MIPQLTGIARVILKVYPNAKGRRAPSFTGIPLQKSRRYVPTTEDDMMERAVLPAHRVSLDALESDLFRQQFALCSILRGEDLRGPFLRFMFAKSYGEHMHLTRRQSELGAVLAGMLYNQTWMTRIAVTGRDTDLAVRIRSYSPHMSKTTHKPLAA